QVFTTTPPRSTGPAAAARAKGTTLPVLSRAASVAAICGLSGPIRCGRAAGLPGFAGDAAVLHPAAALRVPSVVAASPERRRVRRSIWVTVRPYTLRPKVLR